MSRTEIGPRLDCRKVRWRGYLAVSSTSINYFSPSETRRLLLEVENIKQRTMRGEYC